MIQNLSISRLLKAAGLITGATARETREVGAWTKPKTPVEILSDSLRVDRDWQIAPREVHRHGISISWKRAIEGRFPGITLRIDGANRPLSNHESHLLAACVRRFLSLAT